MNTIADQSGAAYSGKQLHIADIAERLFAERGFEGTSVRDIAQKAGVNVAMISYYFGSKEKLLEAIVTSRVSAGRLVLEHLLNDQSLEPIAKINILVESIVDRMMGNKCFHRLMLRAQLDGGNESILNQITAMKLKNLELVTKLIQEGQRKKVFVKSVDASLLMMTMIGTIYQAAGGSQYLRISMKAEGVTEEEHDTAIRKKLKIHLKQVLKATLTYDGK